LGISLSSIWEKKKPQTYSNDYTNWGPPDPPLYREAPQRERERTAKMSTLALKETRFDKSRQAPKMDRKPGKGQDVERANRWGHYLSRGLRSHEGNPSKRPRPTKQMKGYRSGLTIGSIEEKIDWPVSLRRGRELTWARGRCRD